MPALPGSRMSAQTPTSVGTAGEQPVERRVEEPADAPRRPAGCTVSASDSTASSSTSVHGDAGLGGSVDQVGVPRRLGLAVAKTSTDRGRAGERLAYGLRALGEELAGPARNARVASRRACLDTRRLSGAVSAAPGMRHGAHYVSRCRGQAAAPSLGALTSAGKVVLRGLDERGERGRRR